MKQAYLKKRFSQESLTKIAQANTIIEDYQARGLVMTLRQLYYQFVRRNWIRNVTAEYKKLGEVVSNGRLAGYIDWSALEDRTRNLSATATWATPSEITHAAARGFNRDKWTDQARRLEVWVEKEALSGVFAGICNEYEVPLMACKGYMSQSEQRAAGQRIRYHWKEHGQETVVLHFGDHDPSGIDMTRDIEDRLSLFAGVPVEIRRLALNTDQIEQYNPPPNPAKQTDPRFEDYRANFGDESWELDALDPTTLADLVRSAVTEYIDPEAWDAVVAQQEEERKTLIWVAEHWTQVERRARK